MKGWTWAHEIGPFEVYRRTGWINSGIIALDGKPGGIRTVTVIGDGDKDIPVSVILSARDELMADIKNVTIEVNAENLTTLCVTMAESHDVKDM